MALLLSALLLHKKQAGGQQGRKPINRNSQKVSLQYVARSHENGS